MHPLMLHVSNTIIRDSTKIWYDSVETVVDVIRTSDKVSAGGVIFIYVSNVIEVFQIGEHKFMWFIAFWDPPFLEN